MPAFLDARVSGPCMLLEGSDVVNASIQPCRAHLDMQTSFRRIRIESKASSHMPAWRFVINDTTRNIMIVTSTESTAPQIGASFGAALLVWGQGRRAFHLHLPHITHRFFLHNSRMSITRYSHVPITLPLEDMK